MTAIAFLSIGITFYDIFAQACAEIKIKVFGQESDLHLSAFCWHRSQWVNTSDRKFAGQQNIIFSCLMDI